MNSKPNSSPVSFTFADDDQSPSPHRPNRSGGRIIHTNSANAKPVITSNSPPRTNSTPPRPERQSPVRETMLTRLGRASSSGSEGTAASTNDKSTLNLFQQHAMDEFLRAQQSGDAYSKQEKWRELVSAMKQNERHSKSYNRSRSQSSRGSSRSSRDEILGFIRIGGGSVGGDSFASGLTSPTTSPMGSPCEERKYSLPEVGESYFQARGRDGDDETLPTFPSLPGHPSSLQSFPSMDLSGNHHQSSMEEEEKAATGYFLQKRSSCRITDPAAGESNVFLNIAKEVTESDTSHITSKASVSTWDSLITKSNECDPSITASPGAQSESSNKSNNIVRNLVGRYESSTKRSIRTQEPSSFFQRTNPISNSINRENSQVPKKTTSVNQTQQKSTDDVKKPQKKSLLNHPRVVSASPASLGMVIPQKEVDTSQSSHRSGRKKNSLEQQVRNVLEKQESHTLLNANNNNDNMPRSPSFTSLPLHSKPSLSRRTQSDSVASVASAQDILAELRRSPTPLSAAANSGEINNKGVLPRSISVGPSGSPKRSFSRSDSANRVDVRSPSPLPPSRRDLPRLNRQSRRNVSESNVISYASVDASVNESFMSGAPSSVNDSEKGSPPPSPLGASFANDPSPPKSRTPSPVMGAPPKPTQDRSTTFNRAVSPCTSPLTAGSEEGSKHKKSYGLKQFGLPPSKRDVPTITSTRRLPSVKEIAARFNSQIKSSGKVYGQMKPLESTPPASPGISNAPNKNDSPTSSGSKGRIDEIRASISQLKHEGVGGIGKATSTLVRNQATGRYIIRDVDDVDFDDIVMAEMQQQQEKTFLDKLNEGEEEKKVQNRSMPLFDLVEEKNNSGDVTAIFRQDSLNGSTFSDGVVEDAVRAAIDAISSTSDDVSDFDRNSDVNATANQDFAAAAAAENDDFFVVSSSGNQWSSFQTTTNNRLSVEDAFDIDPQTDWDDSGSDEWRDEKDSGGCGFIDQGAPNAAKVINFPSPTSVIQGPNRNAISKKSKKDDVVAFWDPFGM